MRARYPIFCNGPLCQAAPVFPAAGDLVLSVVGLVPPHGAAASVCLTLRIARAPLRLTRQWRMMSKTGDPMLHGGEPPPPSKPPESGPRPPAGAGYRNLFGAVESSNELFRGYGDQNEDLLLRLSRCIEMPYVWETPAPGGRRPDDNPRIPAGYTYLAQLVAHDLSFLGSTIPPIEATNDEPINLRGVALDLETIYGGGPLERPSSFCREPDASSRRKERPSSFRREPDASSRRKLRLGVLRDEIAPAGARMSSKRRQELTRDLPRTACPRTSDVVPGLEGRLTDVLIPDPRNDDHPIIAQTVVLFHHLHNWICDTLPRNAAAISPDHFDVDSDNHLSAHDRDLFTSARRLVTAVYHEIIQRDLMKRLLCRPVYVRYTEGAAPLLDNDQGSGIPVEFSHAAFRVGHAMIQPSYKLRHEVDFGLEDLMRFNSERSFDRFPPSWNWIVKWSNFYEIGKPPLNFSRRISPSQARVLTRSPLTSLADDPSDPSHHTGLPRRDLLRTATVGCRSVESLVRHIRAGAPELATASPLLRDANPAARRTLIRTYLDAQARNGEPFSEQERDRIAADPPLILFVLLEAAVEENGLSLGVLGSVIVAEVIFRAIANASRVVSRGGPDANALARSVFGDDPDLLPLGVFAAAMPRTMPELISFLAKLPHLDGVEPEFV